jgi:hypothetical protein
LNGRAQEYPQPDIRGPMPVNAHPDSTFSSFTHNDWTQVQTDANINMYMKGIDAFTPSYNDADAHGGYDR